MVLWRSSAKRVLASWPLHGLDGQRLEPPGPQESVVGTRVRKQPGAPAQHEEAAGLLTVKVDDLGLSGKSTERAQAQGRCREKDGARAQTRSALRVVVVVVVVVSVAVARQNR